MVYKEYLISNISTLFLLFYIKLNSIIIIVFYRYKTLYKSNEFKIQELRKQIIPTEVIQ